jgi:23S rRNA G2445 N2-methylase RlmL
MKAITWTHPGLEDVSAHETKERISSKTSIEDNFILFDTDIKNLCRLCYEAQSIRGLVLSLGELDLDDLDRSLVNIDYGRWLNKDTPFAVRAHKFRKEFDTHEIESVVGAHINRVTKAPVDLDEPKVTVAILASAKRCIIGIDLAGIDLGKREYKIFSRPASLKGSLAYCMLQVAGFSEDKVLVDPFAKDGVIAVEAALQTMNRSPHFFQKERLAFTRLELPFKLEEAWTKWDAREPVSAAIHCFDSQFHNVQALKKNAKVAGADKFIDVSRVEIDWLDTKFKDNTVDCIVTYPPEPSQHSDNKFILKLHNELFHQASYVLKSKGTMVIAVRNTDFLKLVKKDRMKQIKSLEVWQGQLLLHIVVFQKL